MTVQEQVDAARPGAGILDADANVIGPHFIGCRHIRKPWWRLW